MSTTNINTNLPSRGLVGEGAPAPVTPQKTSAAPVELPKVAVKSTPSPEQLKNMVDKANQSLNKSSSQLEFSVDNATDKTVIKVKEAQSGKLIMQFPSEEMLSVTRAIDRAQQGVLLKDKA
jgi:flagellar protein FlaG